MAIFDVSWSDTLGIGDLFATNWIVGTWSDTLFITEKYTQNHHEELYKDNLHIEESWEVGFVVKHLNFSDTLIINDTYHRCYEPIYQDFLIVRDEFWHGQTFNWVDTLNLVEHLDGSRSNTISDQLIINESFGFNLNRTLTFSDNLTINEILAPNFIDTRITNPIDNPPTPLTPVVPTPPPLGTPYNFVPVIKTVVFNGVGSVTLPAPEFGDSDKQSAKRVQMSVKDSLHTQIFRENYWSTTRQLSMTFAHLTETQKENLKMFVSKNVGVQITIVDYWQRSWNVIILNPNLEITQNERKGYSVTVQFQKVS